MFLVLLSTVIHTCVYMYTVYVYIYYSLNKSILEEVSDIDQQTVITEYGAT